MHFFFNVPVSKTSHFKISFSHYVKLICAFFQSLDSRRRSSVQKERKEETMKWLIDNRHPLKSKARAMQKTFKKSDVWILRFSYYLETLYD